ncbi:DUF6612 family protein [Wukongibacter baidiensis]|uniref:DUF6612 family protein n=1 Tax=Wukongibacter baidiensis TaxID=1723361 RepID=UPI003D7F6E06
MIEKNNNNQSKNEIDNNCISYKQNVINKIYEQAKNIKSCHISKKHYISDSNEQSNNESNTEIDLIFNPIKMYQKYTSTYSEIPIEIYITDDGCYEKGLDKNMWYTLNNDRVDYAIEEVYMTFATTILDRFINYKENFQVVVDEDSYIITIDATKQPLLDVALQLMNRNYSYSPNRSLKDMKENTNYKILSYKLVADNKTYNVNEIQIEIVAEVLIYGIYQKNTIKDHIKISNHNNIDKIIVSDDIKEEVKIDSKNSLITSRLVKDTKPRKKIIDDKPSKSYTIKNNAVYYGNTKIKMADSDSFKIINNNFGIDKKSMFFKGKKTNLDISTFTIFNDTFVKDNKQVYFIMQSKLKAIKTDANSFIALNEYFGKDKSYIYYCSKRMKVNDRESFKVIKECFAYDKNYIYVENSRFKHNIKNKIEQCEIRIYDKEKKNVLIILNDNIFFLDHCYKEQPIIIKDADPLTIKFLNGDYLVDKNHFYYQNRIIENYRSQTVKEMDSNSGIIMLNNKVFSFGKEIADVDVETFRSMGYYYFDKNNIYDLIDREEVITREISPLSYYYNELKQALDLILKELFYFYDHYAPVELFNAKKDDNYIIELPDYELVIEGANVTIIYGKTKISGKISAFTLLGAKLWSLTRDVTIDGEPFSRILFYKQSYEDGYRLIDIIQQRCFKEFIKFALYFYNNNEIDEAIIIMYKLIHKAHEFDRPDVAVEMLSCCSYELLNLVFIEDEEYMTKTTYLALAKEAISLYNNDNCLVRLKYVKKLIGVIACTSEIEKFYEPVILYLINMIENEKVDHIRELLYQALEMAIYMLYIRIKDDRGLWYKRIYSLVKFQVSKGINMDLNLARLWECAHVAGTVEEIQQLEEKLVEIINAKIKGAPINTLGPNYPNYAVWLLHASVRIAYLGTKEYATKMVKHIVEQLNVVRKSFPISSVGCYIMLQQEIISLCKYRNIPLPFENYTNNETLSHFSNRYKTMVKSDFIITDVEILEQGSYIVGNNPLKPILSISKLCSGKNLKLSLGQSIGIEYFIEGQPWGRQINAEIKVYHPKEINGSKMTCYNYNNYIGLRNSFYWIMEEPEELQEGKWTIIISYPELEVKDITIDFEMSITPAP